MGSLKVNEIAVFTDTAVAPPRGLALVTDGTSVFGSLEAPVVNVLENGVIELPARSVAPDTENRIGGIHCERTGGYKRQGHQIIAHVEGTRDRSPSSR